MDIPKPELVIIGNGRIEAKSLGFRSANTRTRYFEREDWEFNMVPGVGWRFNNALFEYKNSEDASWQYFTPTVSPSLFLPIPQARRFKIQPADAANDYEHPYKYHRTDRDTSTIYGTYAWRVTATFVPCTGQLIYGFKSGQNGSRLAYDPSSGKLVCDY